MPDRRRAGASYAEPRTEPPSEAAEPVCALPDDRHTPRSPPFAGQRFARGLADGTGFAPHTAKS